MQYLSTSLPRASRFIFCGEASRGTSIAARFAQPISPWQKGTMLALPDRSPSNGN
jgi:hypothetical protein